MTNKEKYKQAFSGLHASIDVGMEDIMKKKSANIAKRIAVAAVALAIGFAGSNGVCYAATGETWVEKVFLKVNGVDTEVKKMELEEGMVGYEIELPPYQNEGNLEEQVAIIISDEENLENVNVTYDETGRENGITVEFEKE
ncbi:MAG: hypothetical protein IKJ39_01555 [Lachnospiraceae bacterium]|nr:hypothetical protein [Lachnospiraceae bacterium]